MDKQDLYILGFDLETMPNLVRTWRKWEQDVIWYVRYGYIWSISWCELRQDGKVKVFHKNITDFPLYKKDKYSDEALVKFIWNLFDKAPIIMAHNGNAFDTKTMYSRFLHYRLPPPHAFKQIDTKVLYKKYLNEDSNSLNDIVQKHWDALLKIAKENKIKVNEEVGKVDTGGYKLWKGCEDGNKKDIAKMKEYNDYDVVMLVLAYLLIRPYAETHPNMALLSGKPVACRICEGFNLQKRGVVPRVSGLGYQRWQCKDCGAWSSSPVKEGSQIR